MRKFYLFLLLSVCFFQFNNNLIAQSNEHANVVEINHICEKYGMIEVELLNEEGIQNYYWEHGSTDLILTELEPGIYVFVVEKKSGCIVKLEVEIMEVERCDFRTTVIDDRKCTVTVIIEAQINGIPVAPNALDITWNDGGHGLVRTFRKDKNYEYCVEIVPAGGNEKCCHFEDCFKVEGDKRCHQRKEIIVNEFSTNSDGKKQYVELLIVGDGECEGYFDMRGYHLDDNNGFLIPANQFVTPNTMNNIGANSGYLTFNFHENWEKVPNGSLVLIVDGRGDEDRNIPEIDPYDSNGDNVYVLYAYDFELLSGKIGNFDADITETNYSGVFDIPYWEKVKINTDADGMQVRYPDGEYCHGISRGQTPFAELDNDFELWITPESEGKGNCRFVKEDELLKEHFICNEPIEDFQSPGKANSEENAALIAGLLDCEESQNLNSTSGGEEVTEGRNNSNKNYDGDSDLQVYPNPFRETVNIEFTVEKGGPATVVIYTPSGQVSHSFVLDCLIGKNSHRLQFGENKLSGLHILSLTYPSGRKEYVKVVQTF